MKTLVLCLFLFAISLMSPAQKVQKANVPAAVSSAFQQEFPKAADIEWKKKDSLYQVEFNLGAPKKDHEVLYNLSGKIVYHEEDIVIDELPPLVLKEIRNLYPGFQIEDIERTENRGVVTYHMEVEKDSEEWKLHLDAEGKVLDKKQD